MFRYKHGLDIVHQALQFTQVMQVQRVGRSNRKTDSMKAQFIVRAYLYQEFAMGAAWPKVILTMGFEPANRRQAGNDLLVMLSPKADAGPQAA
jgi:hypothetical protein